jgi:hypothetical protein
MGQAYNYGSARQGFAALLQQGGPAALLKGYWATNSVWLPWNVLYTAAYEASKQALAQRLQLPPGAELPGWGYAGASAASAALAAVPPGARALPASLAGWLWNLHVKQRGAACAGVCEGGGAAHGAPALSSVRSAGAWP